MNANGQFASVKPGSSLLGGSPREEEFTQPGDHYDHRDSRRGSTMSTSTLMDTEMQGVDGLEHSDDDRKGHTRPNLSNFR